VSNVATLQVALVPPEVWQPRLEAALGDLDRPVARFARAAVETLHNRHIGITPELAADLGRAVLDPRAQDRVPVWSTVFARLLDTLAGASLSTHDRRARFGLVFNANPIYCINRIAAPLIDRAARAIGTIMLFCEEPVQPLVAGDRYDRHADELAEAITAEAQRIDAGDDLFWQEIALTLSSFSRQTQSRAAGVSVLPQMEPESLGMLLRLRTRPNETRRRMPRRRTLTSARKQRSLRNRKEGGIDGIQITRRAEDLDDMLLSELIHPDAVLMDRIANTGFFAVRRQPKREKTRDVLMGAILPIEDGNELVADFIKAAWFEAIMHLSLMLRRGGMNRSEIRWTEGHPHGATRQSVFLLSDMPVIEGVPDGPPSEAYRRELLTALGWLPAFLDVFHPGTHFPDGPGFARGSALDELEHWMFAAWSAQREHIKWQREDGPRQSRISVREYSHVHVTVMLPSALRGPDHAAELGAVFAGLGLLGGANRHVSILWYPAELIAGEGWLLERRGRAGRPLFSESENELGARAMAERIVGSWLQLWTKEIWRG